MRIPSGRVAILVAALAAGIAAAPASAGGSGYGSAAHTDHPGLHWLLDNPGPDPHSPPVLCVYGGPNDELQRMVIRQPVLFADVSGGPRTQRVGYRAYVYRASAPDGPWNPYDTTPYSRANATGKIPADLTPKTFEFPANVEQNLVYRVVYQMEWYAANGTTVVDYATHRPYWYGIKGGGFTQEYCYSTNAPVAAVRGPRGASTGPHTGKRGLHWILEMVGPYPELPPVTCVYGGDDLQALKIRRPIMFARDTGPGVQGGDVGWKAIIQSTDSLLGPVSWQTVAQTTVTRKHATDAAWADFLPKQVADVGSLEGVAFRVIYRLIWYKGAGTAIAGLAEHRPVWYKVQLEAIAGWHEDFCLQNASG